MTTDLDIIVPILPSDSPERLDACFTAIAENTGVRSVRLFAVLVADHKVHPESLHSGYPLPWTAFQPNCEDYDAAICMATEEGDGAYMAIVPPTHVIADNAWFAKLQQPFLVTPQCGLAIACDDQKLSGTGMQPFPVLTNESPGRLMLAPRLTMRAIARAAKDGAYADQFVRGAKSLGLVPWGIPAVRLDIAEPAGAGGGKK